MTIQKRIHNYLSLIQGSPARTVQAERVMRKSPIELKIDNSKLINYLLLLLVRGLIY